MMRLFAASSLEPIPARPKSSAMRASISGPKAGAWRSPMDYRLAGADYGAACKVGLEPEEKCLERPVTSAV